MTVRNYDLQTCKPGLIKYYCDNEIKGKKGEKVCGMYGEEETCTQSCGGETGTRPFKT